MDNRNTETAAAPRRNRDAVSGRLVVQTGSNSGSEGATAGGCPVTVEEALTPATTVAVIGAGAMGAGIAQVAALRGHPVQLHDSRFGASDAAKAAIGDALRRLTAKGKLEDRVAQAALARITTVVTMPDTCSAGLVIEAIVEDLAAKRTLLRDLENIVAPSCILATNTSSLSITEIAAGLAHPERVVGMHFFNPVPLMPLVEVVAGLATEPAVARTVFATAIAWGKTPVHARSTPGFIVNRCSRPYSGEAFRLLAEGAAEPATIDAILREAGGFKMGPFELVDLTGLDINTAVTTAIWEAYGHDPRYAPTVLQRERVAAGLLGRKSGRGFYAYVDDAGSPIRGALSTAPSTEPSAPPPAQVVVLGPLGGDSGLVEALADRIGGSGLAVAREAGDPRFPCGAIRLSGTCDAGDAGDSGDTDAWLVPSDGRTATAMSASAGARDVVVFDLALDYATTSRLAIAAADTCSQLGLLRAIGALQVAGIAVSRIDDAPGLVVLRTVAMLANEAAEAVLQGVGDAEGIDTAMRLGVSYPRGPLAWADALGPAWVRDVLANLAAHYGDGRYRPSPLLVRRALAAGRFHP